MEKTLEKSSSLRQVCPHLSTFLSNYYRTRWLALNSTLPIRLAQADAAATIYLLKGRSVPRSFDNVKSNLGVSNALLEDSIQPLEDNRLLTSSSLAGPEYFRIKVELHAILAAQKQTTTKFRA
jgi:hypothetical protein